MKTKKTSSSPLDINLLLLAVIASLFVLFVYMLKQKPFMEEPQALVPTPNPITSVKELDMILEELNKEDITGIVNTELNKLSSEASGI